MEWPETLAPTLPSQATRGRLSPASAAAFRDDILELSPAAPPRAWVFATRNTMDRKTLALTLVNWMILLVLFCGFLLAKTLPADTALSGTTGAGVSATATR